MNTSNTNFVYIHMYSLPDDCSMDDLMSVMGATRLKKIGRKNRRNRNQKIREGKVVLNEKGEWVPREEV